jgi:hypothetical protein
MASIKAGIANKLAALAVTPFIFHRELPQNPTYPATVYDVISDTVVGHTHDNLVVGFRRARIQIDVYAETVAEAEDAMENYFAALVGFKGSIGDDLSPSQFTDVSIFDIGSNPDYDFEEEPTLRHIEGRSRDFTILY